MSSAALETGIRDYLQVVFRRVWIIISVTALALAVTAGYAYTRVEIFEAQNEVEIVERFRLDPLLKDITKVRHFQQRLESIMRDLKSREGALKIVAAIGILADDLPDLHDLQRLRADHLALKLERRRSDLTAQKQQPEVDALLKALERQAQEVQARLESSRTLFDQIEALRVGLRKPDPGKTAVAQEAELLAPVHAQLERQAGLVADISADLTVNLYRDTLQVSFQSSSPDIAKAVVDAVIDDLEWRNLDTMKTEVDVSEELLTAQRDELQREVLQTRKLLESDAFVEALQYFPEAPGRNLEDLQKMPALKSELLDKYSNNEQRRKEALIELKEEQVRLEQLLGDLRTTSTDLVEVDTQVEDSSQGGPLKARLAHLELELADMRGRHFSEIHPLMVNARRDIEALRAQLRTVGQQVTRSQKSRPNPAHAELEKLTRESREHSKKLRVRVEELSRYSEIYAEELRQLPAKRLAFLQANNDLVVLTNQLATITRKLKDAETTRKYEVERRNATFKKRAETVKPLVPIRPNRRMILVLGGMVGIFLAGAMVFAVEYADHSLSGISDVNRFIDLPLLGVIAEFELQDEEIRLLSSEARRRPGLGKQRLLVLLLAVIFLVVAALAWEHWKASRRPPAPVLEENK